MSNWKQYAANVIVAAIGIAALVYLFALWGSESASPSAVGQSTATSETSGASGATGISGAGAASGSSSTSGQAAAVTRSASAQTPRTIRIGWTAWTDAEFITKIAQRVLEDRFGLDVELVMADIGIQYQGVANGDLDAMLMAWLPQTHRDYWRRFSSDIVNLGILYTRARLGWAVPAYVPEEQLGSIADLAKPALRRRLGGRIQGIDPGSGLMQASERAVAAYRLEDYELVTASGAAMTAALARAIERNEWIVVTAWSPHWMFARWDLRYLDDPKAALGGRERVDVIVRKGFYQDFPPEVSEFLTRMFVPIDELEAALLTATEESVDAAVDDYLQVHAARVEYWVTGDVPPGG